MIQFQQNIQKQGGKDGKTDRQKDERTLFYRTLLATAGDPKIGFLDSQ